MKTDLLLMPMGARYADMRRAAVAAEEAGFDGCYVKLRPPPNGATPTSGAPDRPFVLATLIYRKEQNLAGGGKRT